MCILKACEEPTEQGVWWRDDTKWCLYSDEHQALIKKGIAEKLEKIDLGRIVSNVHPSGAKYTLNLREMRQVAVSSGQERPIIVVDSPTVQAQQKIRKSAALPKKSVKSFSQMLSAEQALPKKSVKELPLTLHYKSEDGEMHRYAPAAEQALLQWLKKVASVGAVQKLAQLEVGQDCLPN